MKFRILGMAAAAALALGAFSPGPASAAAIAPIPAVAQTAIAGSVATPVQYRGGYHYPRNHWRRSRYGHRYHYPRRPSWGFQFHVGPRYYGSPCWRTRSVWTPYGYRYQRVWVCY